MRHRKSGRRLGVPSNRRKAMLKQLVEALFLHGRIHTTVTRAKETQPLAERAVTWAKKGTLHHRRQALRVIHRTDVVARLFDQIVEWYKERQGGYTRIIKTGPRPGDGAPMAFLELVDWVSGDKLPGQNLKVVKAPEGEGDKEKEKTAKAKKKAQEKEKKAKTKKAAKPEAEGKTTKTKDPEKEKKIAERQAEKEKARKERASTREQVKKAKQEQKAKKQTATAPKTTAKKAVARKAAKKKTTAKAKPKGKG